MPAFSPGNIKGMFEDMFDVATQLVLKWERFGSEYRIDPTDDFTRLALDTIALCSMHYRINSFYTVSRSEVYLWYISLTLSEARDAPLRSSNERFLDGSSTSRQPTRTHQCDHERGYGKVPRGHENYEQHRRQECVLISKPSSNREPTSQCSNRGSTCKPKRES